jgi:hypothetical protein
MQVADIPPRTGGLRNIAQELGLSESQAASGAEALYLRHSIRVFSAIFLFPAR